MTRRRRGRSKRVQAVKGGALLPLGRLSATPRALEALALAGQTPENFLARHASGDWGDLSDADRRANAHALKTGGRILSAYVTILGERLWIITEADRSRTTILRPDEY
jgi:hypothetical protein